MTHKVSYRLIDVPEMGYLTSDKPFPRGELLIKSDVMTSGIVSYSITIKDT